MIVDEAHHIRNTETFLHQGVRYFCDNAQAVLLLTATPVQLGSDDLFTLLNVLRPDLVIDRASFEQMAEPNRHINAAVQHCRMARAGLAAGSARLPERCGPDGMGAIVPSRSARLSGHLTTGFRNDSLDDSDRVGLTRAIEELYTFSPLINRTRRRDIGEFTTRKPETLTIDFTPDQKRLHDGLLDVIARILARCHGQQNVKFMMTTIRRQAASCLYGLAPLPVRHPQRQAGPPGADGSKRQRRRRQNSASSIKSGRTSRPCSNRRSNLDPNDPKVEAFVRVLLDKNKRPNNKALVFSTFRHTLAYLDAHARRTEPARRFDSWRRAR